MALLEEMQAALGSPEFQAIQNPAAKLQAFQGFLSAKSPEFAAIPDPALRADAAIRAMQAADPQTDWGEIAKTVGTTAVGLVPFVGPALQTALVGEARPWTQAAMHEDASLPEQVFMEGVRGVVEDALMFGPLLRFGKAVSGATRLSARAAASANRVTQSLAPVIEHAVGLGTAGALFGVLDNIEHEEFNPGTILLSGAMGAVTGALVGIPAARRAFAENPRMAQALQQEAQVNPRVAETLDGIVEQRNVLTKGVTEHLKMPEADAQAFVARALSEDLSPGEFHSLRTVMGKDSEFLKTDLGLAILQRQRDHLMPKVYESDSPLQIRVENSQGEATTVRPMKRAEVRDLIRQHQDGEIYITEVIGRANEVRSIRGRLGLEPPSTSEGPLALPGRAVEIATESPQVERTPVEATTTLPAARSSSDAPASPVVSEVTSSFAERTSQLQALGTPLPARLEAGLNRFDLDQLSTPLDRAVHANVSGRLGPEIDSQLKLDTIQQPAVRALMPGMTHPEQAPITAGATPRGVLAANLSASPGSTVKFFETGASGIVTRQDGPLVYVKTPTGEVPAIPMANGTVRTTVPSVPVALQLAKTRQLGKLSDQELMDGSALLGRKAMAATGKERGAAIESHARYLDELDRRFGSRPVIAAEGSIASHIKNCL